MNILIIEDEPIAAEKLSNYIIKYNPKAHIQGPLDTIAKVQEFFSGEEFIDLIFSDIELLDGPSFIALEQLNLPCPVIYTTAYNTYWMQAFQNMGIEYLLKPYSYKRFIEAMFAFEQLKEAFSPASEEQLHITNRQSYRRRFLLRKRLGMEVLQVDDIVCLRANKGIIMAYDNRGNCHSLVQQSVTDIETQLNPQDFFRINRSDIINIHSIQRFENYSKDTLAIYLAGVDEPLITSKTRSPKFRQWLDN